VSRRIRTAVVDDEPIARRILHDLLAADPEIELVAEGAAAALLGELPALGLELLFLDVEMPEVSGFELLERLDPGAEPPVVVFVTAYDRYAVAAFEVHAADYLLKPFTDERFAAALERAKARVRERGGPRREALAHLLDEVRARRGGRGLERLLVRVGEKTVVVPVADVEWIEAADYYARLHCGGRSYLVRESLTALERALDPAAFCRVHRSAIVRLEAVAEVHPHFASDSVVVLRDGRRLPLARSRRRDLESRLAGA
jgi:two-component system, LytTR family, response regulator